MRTAELFAFMRERHAIYERRQAGMPKPWTDDPILQTYKFCNIYRELDYGTQWFKRGWRERHADNPDLWFASLVYRLVNWPDTMDELGFPVPWSAERFIKVLQARKASRLKVYSGAYMISTHGVREEKATYLARSLSLIWKRRKDLRPTPFDNCQSFHARLMGCFDIGSFLAAQVVADIKYTTPLNEAEDWWTFAASGPGSRGGLNWVCERPFKAAWKEEDWYTKLMELKAGLDPLIKAAKMPKMHAQDLQNCLCETFKRAKLIEGVGRPKQKYKGV